MSQQNNPSRPSQSSNQFIAILIYVFVTINIVLFILMNFYPIYWIQHELLSHRVFWSMSKLDDLVLHTGFQKIDLIKPFLTNCTEGTFRLRQFSYLTEMLSFKFWQYFEMGVLKNYTHIALHLLNSVLLAVVIFYLTRNKRTAVLSFVMFLNAGVAMATLLYPFRNAKLLVVAFFLLAWIMVERPPGEISRFSTKKLLVFFACLLTALFTDELSVFLYMVIFVYVIFRDGRKEIFNRRFLLCMFVSFILFIALAYRFYQLSLLDLMPLKTGITLKHLTKMFGYYLHPILTLRDSIVAFAGYFLFRTFGLWERTVLGFLSFSSFVLFLILFVRKPNLLLTRLSLSICIIIGIKNLLMPHTAGFHPTIMPAGTLFPSLFFFSYYYVYVDVVLLVMALALLVNKRMTDNRPFLLALVLMTIVSVSHAVYLRHGPLDALIFHKDNDEKREQLVKNTLAVKSYLSQSELRPVYLSLIAPELSQSNSLDYTTSLASIIYLPSIEGGRAIVSFLPPKDILWRKDEELIDAKYFYDVVAGRGLNLEELRQEVGERNFLQQQIDFPQGLTNQQIIVPRPSDNIIFFIKGSAKFLLRVGNQPIAGEQVYGNAYQMFRFNFDLPANLYPLNVYMSILPTNPRNVSYLTGPFVVKEDPVKDRPKE